MLEKVKDGINKGILSASVNFGAYLEMEKVKGRLVKEKGEIEQTLNEMGKQII